MAAEKGYADVIRLLIERGAITDAKDAFEETALHPAAANSCANIAQFSLEPGAKIDAKNVSEKTTLHLTAENGHAYIIQLLLDYGANIEAGDIDGRTALHLATDEGSANVVRILLERGANVDANNKFEVAALNLAAQKGRENGVRELLVKGADIESKNYWGDTAWHLVDRRGRAKIQRLLSQKGAHVEAKSPPGRLCGASQGSAKIVQSPLKRAVNFSVKDRFTESTPPFTATAAKTGHEGKAEQPSQRNPNISFKPEDYTSPGASFGLSKKRCEEDPAVNTKRRKQEENESLPSSSESPFFAGLDSYWDPFGSRFKESET